jgi:hypothetical protein
LFRFYADFYLNSESFSTAQLESISKEMSGIIKSKREIKLEQLLSPSPSNHVTVSHIMGVPSEVKSHAIIGTFKFGAQVVEILSLVSSHCRQRKAAVRWRRV